MKLHYRTFPLFLLTLFIHVVSIYGQNEGTVTDSSFAAYMNSANAHLEKTQYYDRLQYKYAGDFYEYYLKNPDTEIGKTALKDAVIMWINIGETENLLSALHHIHYGSDVWYDILRMINNSSAFHYAKHAEYITLMNKLEKNITDPKNRTAVLFLLAYDYWRRNNLEEVKRLYREILKLDADDFYTKFARSFLYETDTLGIGRQAPDFEVKTVDGEILSLSDQRGKIVIIDFWATWCGPCIREIPNLQMLRAEFDKNELQIIGISLDEDEKKLRDFFSKHVMDWPQIMQPQSYKDELPKRYNVQGLPKTFLIDADGRILAKNLWGEYLIKEVTKLLRD